MSNQMDELIEHVTNIETIGDSAIALITGLKERLDAAIAADDPAALADLSARLGAQAAELAMAIAANTPVDPIMDPLPEPVPEPTPEPAAA